MNSDDQSDRLLTMQEAAQRLRVSARFIRAAVRSRSISCIRVGRLVRFRPKDLDEYTLARRVPVRTSLTSETRTGHE